MIKTTIQFHKSQDRNGGCQRRGSTLVIVIALLGLLSFLGIVFFTFAAQEKAAAQYFSEAAKAQTTELDDVFDWGLRQLLVGPSANERNSILYSPTQRHSMVRNAFGNDFSPHSGGSGIPVAYNGARIPLSLTGGTAAETLIDMVDSPVAWGLQVNQNAANAELSQLFRLRGAEQGALPAPDVDYTYPDINSMFLAYRGYAIRDNSEDANGNGTLDTNEDRDGDGSLNNDADGDGILDVTNTPRFEQIPVTIPSFLRPALMKTVGGTNAPNSSYVPMDRDWATADHLDTSLARRSFRPHPSHLTRDWQDETVLPRYFRTATESSAAGIISGPFPFLPANAGANETATVQGEMGIWTGSHPTTYELDVDNDQFVESDGSTTNEGIWMDLDFPLQEAVDGSGAIRYYVVLHSYTVYDLDSLINIGVHGNINNLVRAGLIQDRVSAGEFQDRMLSASNQGSGPHEVNPLYALRRDDRTAPYIDPYSDQINNLLDDTPDQFIANMSRVPTSPIEQANMEWLMTLVGRGQFSGADLDDIYPGRWGDVQELYRALTIGHNDLGLGAGAIAAYPRPGRSDGLRNTISGNDGVRFGGGLSGIGAGGYDDNQDRFNGEALKVLNHRRPFGSLFDVAGTGRATQHVVTGFDLLTGRATAGGNPLLTLTKMPGATSATWRKFDGYNVARELLTAVDANSPFHYAQRYMFGPNQALNNFGVATDDLLENPRYDLNLDDPLETVFDPDRARRPTDNAFGSQDLFEMQMAAGDISGSAEAPSDRLSKLAPWALSTDSRNREMITTFSNSMRYVPFAHPFGNDGRPGRRGFDDDGDGTIDNPSEVLATSYSDRDSAWRWQEWTADTDGPDRDDDGFPDGDGNAEFPPQFGTIQPFSAADPFRPQLRRLIQVEAGDSSSLLGQLPMSWNHLIDVDRRWDDQNETSSAPPEGTSRFLYYMQRSGLQLRRVTEHPHIDDTGVAAENEVFKMELTPDSDPLTVAEAVDVQFPPELPREREFWARRDRQKMARDIFVLLYTLGGAQLDVNGFPIDYTAENDPALAEGAEDPANLGEAHPNALYTHEQLRRMAQFAVNVVDSIDTDDVVTKFEYDKNLGNGWNLDDDPYTEDFPFATLGGTGLQLADYNLVTNNGLNPEDSGVVDTGDLDGDGDLTDVVEADRGVVYGVEAQQLVLNEVLSVRTQGMAADHPATMHDDSVGEHDFLHIELQNVTPMDVDLGQESLTKDQAIWRIARFDRDGLTTDPAKAPSDFTKAIVLLQNAMTNSILPGGSAMTVATGSPNLSLNLSDLYIDYDSPNNYSAADTWERISPDIDGATNNPADPFLLPGCNVDLHHDDHVTTSLVARVLGDDGNPFDNGPVENTKGVFLENLVNYEGHDSFNQEPQNQGTYDSQSIPGFDLVLQRRLNPHMPNLSEQDNPWIEVDRTRVLFNPLNISDTTATTTAVQNALGDPEAKSLQRSQPFNTTAVRNDPTAAAVNFRFNTISTENSNAVPWNVWHQHLDREFVNAAEAFSVAVVAPQLITRRTEWMRRNPLEQSHSAGRGTLPTGTDLRTDLLANAEAMFLQPDFTDDEATFGAPTPQELLVNQSRDNRWFRILQFIEIPSRVHRMLGNYLTQNRMPGKMNLNMIRHREVYAGLIDDPVVMDLAFNVDTTPYFIGAGTDTGDSFADGPFTTVAGGTGRDRWNEFLSKRDATIQSYDPGSATSAAGRNRIRVPGLPGSQPFRSLADDSSPLGFNTTILGELPADRGAPSVNNRTWLEIGSRADHVGATVGSPGQLTTGQERQQLLSKIMNNTTTVSNTFVVFMTAGLFEAVEDPVTGLVRVGGEFDFDGTGDAENDRKRAIFVIDRTEALNSFDGATGGFDWNRMVKSRLTVQ